MDNPIGSYPDFDKELISLQTLSSTPQGVIDCDKSIAFAPGTLNDNEINYSTTEQKFLAVIWSRKYFRL